MINRLRYCSFSRFAALLAVFSFAVLLTPSVSAQGKQDFVLNNATGVVIHELYVSPHNSNDWEEDILGQDVLVNGESLEINFSPRTKPKLWDLRIVDKDGEDIIWENLNLLEIAEVTIYFKNGKAWAEMK